MDDSPDTLEVLSRNLELGGYEVYVALGAAEAIALLESRPIDLVITDLKMPRVSGLDMIRHVKENYKDRGVMMITGYASIEGAVRAVRTGADEYLAKPFTGEELLTAVARVLERVKIRRAAQADGDLMPAPWGILGGSEPMERIFRAIRKAASTMATVVISGESGTGKELVARAIHYGRPGLATPFVPVNCGGIPEPLLESELFGYMKGAFTGATESRAGFFQTADGGTIFLDEIGDTAASMQVKLLRVLQDKEVFMIGSRRPIKVDVRIIAATNKDLMAMVAKGSFREDLYYRLNVITIEMPPLRDRGDDILMLISHFSVKYARAQGKAVPAFTDEALEVLRNYSWPGNVRELENIIQRLVVMGDRGRIDIPDLPSLMRFSLQRASGLHRPLAEVEEEHIRNVLVSLGGNKSQAAEVLGIDRKTLREKLKRSRPED